MTLIFALSGLGFGALLAVDLSFVRSKPLVRTALMLGACLVLGGVFVLAVQGGQPLGWPEWCTWLGLLLTIVGALLTAYSALLEIPLALYRERTAKSRQDALQEGNAVYRSGTYALCRHPGFLWAMLYLAGVVLLFQRTSTLEMALCWFILDLAVIIIQDAIIFPRSLAGYTDYQRATPLLIPTRTSLQTAIKPLTRYANE